MKKLLAKIINCRSCESRFIRPKHYSKFHNFTVKINKNAIITMIAACFVQFLVMGFVADAGELTGNALLECTNDIRAEYGSEKLYVNNNLNLAAQYKLEDMNYYDYWAHANPHTGKNPWDFVDESGYYYLATGENLAIGYLDSEEVCAAWKDSQVHLANIINPSYQEIGFAINKANLHKNGKGLLVVQMFGSREDFVPSLGTTDESVHHESDHNQKKSVKGASHQRNETDPLKNIWNWTVGNILIIILISGYFVVRTTILCKQRHGGRIQRRCIVVLCSFLAMTVISFAVLYINNFMA